MTARKKPLATAVAAATPSRDDILNKAYRILAHASGVGIPGTKVNYIHSTPLAKARIPLGCKLKPSDKYYESYNSITVKGINDDGDIVLSNGSVMPYTSLRVESKAVGKSIALEGTGRSAQIANDGSSVTVGCTTVSAKDVRKVVAELDRVEAENAKKPELVLSDDPQATWTKAMQTAEDAKKAAKKAENAAKPKAVKKPARRRGW